MRPLYFALAVALLVVVLPLAGEAVAQPTAVLDVRPSNPDVDEIVTFDAHLSSPGNGERLEFKFIAGDDVETDWQTAGVWQHSYSKKGTYTATLIVRNEYDEQDRVDVRIKVGTDNETLLLGLTAMELILVVVIVVLAIGLVAFAVGRRRRRATGLPDIDEAWDTGWEGAYPEEEGAHDAFDEEAFPEEVTAEPPAIDEPEHVEPEIAKGPPGEMGEEEPAVVEPVRPRPKKKVRKKVARPPGPQMKTLLVNCPNCDNTMEIKYLAPPVYLTCDRCGMKGEVPEEMLE